jgi:basic amino acid/polyamine antiporter, APA family
MLMASRLIYGLARQDVLPRSLGHVLRGRRTPWTAIIFTTLLALGLIIYVTYGETSIVEALSGTTGLLLLCVFTIVNISCLVVRRRSDSTPSFRAPTFIPVLGAVASAFLVGPWARDPEDYIQYRIALVLLVIGVVLWALTWLTNRGVRSKKTGFRDVDHLGE